MESLRSTLAEIVSSISPASEAQAAGVTQRLAARKSAGEDLGTVQRLCERLAAARHSPHPVVDAQTLLVFAADHGVADSGVDLGELPLEPELRVNFGMHGPIPIVDGAKLE